MFCYVMIWVVCAESIVRRKPIGHTSSLGSARYTYYIYKGKKTDLNNDVTESKDVVILRHQVARRYGDHTPHNSTI